MTIRVEVFEDRQVKHQDEGGQSYEMHDEIRLGAFDLCKMPRAGEWLSLRAFGAPNFYDGYCFNVYKVQEIWHEGIHTSWDVTADEDYEKKGGPVIKVYVSFSHTLNPGVFRGQICGRTAHALQRAPARA